MTIADLQRTLADFLYDQYGVDAVREARYILTAATGWDAATLIAAMRDPVTSQHMERVQAILARRLAGEPLSRITGVREFYGLDFALNADTLDPRADSETLIDAALAWRKAYGGTPPRILDLGTGSGCLLLTLLHLWPDAMGVGIDRALGAARQARDNAIRLGLADRCLIINGDWMAAVVPGPHFDLVIANPPYIPRQTIATLDKNVHDYDPLLALDGGEDGLDPYKILVYALPSLLTQGGAGLFEVGIGQAADVAAMGIKSGATRVSIHPDSGGIERVVDIRYGDKSKKV